MDLIRTIQKNWQVLALIVALIFSWAKFENDITNLELRTTVLETKVESQLVSQNEIKVQLSQIQTDLQWIKTRLSN